MKKGENGPPFILLFLSALKYCLFVFNKIYTFKLTVCITSAFPIPIYNEKLYYSQVTQLFFSFLHPAPAQFLFRSVVYPAIHQSKVPKIILPFC